MPIMPGGMTGMMLGTDTAVVRAAEPSEKARVQQVLEHLLPVSPRFGGMQSDIKTAATHELYLIEKIACPVLTISAEDDRFGTAPVWPMAGPSSFQPRGHAWSATMPTPCARSHRFSRPCKSAARCGEPHARGGSPVNREQTPMN
jgi:hypothetical protein